jgi:cell division septation protein DedD
MGLGRFRALGAALLTVGLILSTPLAASAEKPTDPGKSSIVAPCKKGGWMALAPEDDAAVPFRNQGECIQYVAQGGSAVATTGTPVAPGQSKGCKAAKQKADKSAASGQQAEPKAKPCKPRKAKAKAHASKDD